MSALPAPVVAKLARTIALLSSDQPGERQAALAATERILTSAGLSWRDVADLVSGGAEPTQPPPLVDEPQPPSAASVWASTGGQRIDSAQLLGVVEAIRRAGTWLSPNSRTFLDGLECKAVSYATVNLSERQHQWLLDLASQAAARTPS